MCARYTWNLKVKVIFLSKLLSAGLSLCVCSDGFREFMHVSATRCIVYKRMCIFHELPVSHATTIKKKNPLPCYYGNRALVFLSCVPFSLSFIIFLFISLLSLHTFLPVSLFSPSCVCVCVHQMEGCSEADSMMTTSAANRIIGSCWWA